MKSTLKVIALILAAGFPLAAFAEFIGVPIAASVHAESALCAFLFVVGALLVAGDYANALPSFQAEPNATANPRRSRAYGLRRDIPSGARVAVWVNPGFFCAQKHATCPALGFARSLP